MEAVGFVLHSQTRIARSTASLEYSNAGGAGASVFLTAALLRLACSLACAKSFLTALIGALSSAGRYPLIGYNIDCQLSHKRTLG